MFSSELLTANKKIMHVYESFCTPLCRKYQLNQSDLDLIVAGTEDALVMVEAGAQEVAERCQRLVEKLQIPHQKSGDSQWVTFSMGVGTLNPSADMAPSGFVDAVDKLLYAAKQKGRNRIEAARF